jgi:hypothetical protein
MIFYINKFVTPEFRENKNHIGMDPVKLILHHLFLETSTVFSV